MGGASMTHPYDSKYSLHYTTTTLEYYLLPYTMHAG